MKRPEAPVRAEEESNVQGQVVQSSPIVKQRSFYLRRERIKFQLQTLFVSNMMVSWLEPFDLEEVP